MFDNLNKKENIEVLLYRLLQKSFEYYLNDYDKFIFIERFANSHHISRIAYQEVANQMNAFFELLDAGKRKWLFIDESNDVLLVILWWAFHWLLKYIHKNKIDNYESLIPLILKWIKK